MTVTKRKSMWPYLLSRFIAILILVFPVCTGVFVVISLEIFDASDQYSNNFSHGFYLWGMTFFYGTWSFLLFVMLPYLLVYIYTSLNKLNVFFKLFTFLMLLFTFLMLLNLMGIVVPEGSVIDFLGSTPYPRVWILYFLLTITLCPLCNIALDRIVGNRALAGKS
ncbi:hypothetical protein [Rufibacter sp. XAAS-G3-1]|uniref:hypothetical protein n=1 Tax=Rufibacter sp. XAAS-G3-1 TaxID=2729134 RepID=UPI0015E658F7|nr:hypothetical protein [Rufibacter sp. XAAS-G3-1]